MSEGELTSCARGLTAGVAAGNLLGIGTEGRIRERIAARFPDGIREITVRTGFLDDDLKQHCGSSEIGHYSVFCGCRSPISRHVDHPGVSE